MNPVLIVLRVLETVFLVGFVFTYTVTPNSQNINFSFLSVFCNFSINSGSDQIVISSAVVGYLISLIGTLVWWRNTELKLRLWPLGLTVLGLIVCLNEIGRYFFGYQFQILIHLPIAVVIINWVLLFRDKKPVVVDSDAIVP